MPRTYNYKKGLIQTMEKPISIKINEFTNNVINVVSTGLNELDSSVVQIVLKNVLNDVNELTMRSYDNDLRLYAQDQVKTEEKKTTEEDNKQE